MLSSIPKSLLSMFAGMKDLLIIGHCYTADFLSQAQDAMAGIIYKIAYLTPCQKVTLRSVTLYKDLRKTFSPLQRRSLALKTFISQLSFLAAVLFFCCHLFDSIQL